MRALRGGVVAALSALLLLGVACSSNGGGATNGDGAGGSGGADPTPEASCVRPGDKGNDVGVGEYCSPFGRQCLAFPGAPLCLADVGQDQWMCTRISCDATTDCGEGAGCLIEKDGSACVPCRCDPRGIGCTDG